MHLGIPEANLSPGREVTRQGAPAQRAAPPQSSGNHVLSEGRGRGWARQLKLGATRQAVHWATPECARPRENRALPHLRGDGSDSPGICARGWLRPRCRAECARRAGAAPRPSGRLDSGLRWRRCPRLRPLTRAEGGAGGGAGAAGRGSHQCPRLRCSFARRSRGRRAARSPPRVPWHSPAPPLSTATSVRSWASRSWGSWTAPAWLCPPRPS